MRGSVFDLMYIFTFLLIFSACTIVAFMLLGEVGPSLSLNPTSTGVIASATTAVGSFDGLFVFMVFGMIAVSAILAYFVDSHPIMFVISFIVYIFVVMISGTISNVYQEFIAADYISASAASFPLMTQIWLQLPTIAVIAGIIIMVVAFAKYRGAGGYGV